MKRSTKIILLVLGIAVAVGAVGSVLGLVTLFWWYGRGVAELDEARLKNYSPPQVTRIYAREGELIGEIYSQRRTLVSYEDIPSHVENAFLAAEDADFYRHEGMDYMGMVRALVANVRAGRVRQGASTITQQVVKIFMLSPERSFERKVQELILARRLEQAFSKKEILELYLNEIFLGHGSYGIEEASRFYFGKSVKDIDLGQAALLATLPKAPGRDSPLKNPKRAKERQRYVLGQMVKHGFATEQEVALYMDADFDLAEPAERPRVEPGAEEFVDEVEKALVERYGREQLDTLGAHVVATVSLERQRAARAAVLENMRALDRRQGYGHRLKPASAKDRKVLLEDTPKLAVGQARRFLVAAPPEGTTLPEHAFAARAGEAWIAVVVPPESRYRDADKTLAEQFPPDAIVEARITALAGDGTSAELPTGWATGRLEMGPEAGIVLVDVETGAVEVMIGGTEVRRAGFNRVTQAKRQPGSSFKPFVYGAALQTRAFTAASLVSDSPEIYEKWRPTNFEADKYLGDIRMRVALTKSINTVAIKLIDKIGVDAVQAFAKAAGITAELPANLSLALGTGEVTPFELARAYLTLARGGSRIEPTVIREVRAPGHEPWTPVPEPEQVLEPEVTFILTSMMQSVVEEGTGTRAKQLGRPAAGKTGTSGDFHDAWFAGFTADKVAVSWVGFDQPRPLGKGETGGKAAAPVWVEVMRSAVAGPPRGFTPPASVSVRRIDAASGLLAPTGDAAEGYRGVTLDEYFIAGTEPVDEATPAALPATDVLLDLYGDATGEAEAALDLATTAAPIAARTNPTAAPADPSDPVGLPSLDEDF